MRASRAYPRDWPAASRAAQAPAVAAQVTGTDEQAPIIELSLDASALRSVSDACASSDPGRDPAEHARSFCVDQSVAAISQLDLGCDALCLDQMILLEPLGSFGQAGRAISVVRAGESASQHADVAGVPSDVGSELRRHRPGPLGRQRCADPLGHRPVRYRMRHALPRPVPPGAARHDRPGPVGRRHGPGILSAHLMRTHAKVMIILIAHLIRSMPWILAY